MTRFTTSLSAALCIAAMTVFGAPAPSVADPDTDADVSAASRSPAAALDGLPDLIGHWKGEGWMRRGPGEPDRFVGEETVWTDLDGEVLLVRGEHWTPDRKRRVHHAFAMLHVAPEGDGYRFRTYLAGGRQGDFPAVLEDGALIWTMDTANGPVRYVIRVDGDTWHEVGQTRAASADGAEGVEAAENRWRTFFEMTLQRVSR